MLPELVKQAAELRAMATRARRLADTINPEDGKAIVAYAKELEQQAVQVEAQLGEQDAGRPSPVVHEQQQAQQQTQTPGETKPKT